jgi:hypothetical protein
MKGLEVEVFLLLETLVEASTKTTIELVCAAPPTYHPILLAA